MKKDRRLIQLNNYLNNFSFEIEKKVNNNTSVKILEAGCGYGLAIAELIKKFGEKIEIVGYNQKKEHGTIKDFKKKSIQLGIFTAREIKKIKIPKIIYLDADKRLPFKDDSFDFIYSLASVYLYKDKIKFFEECNRILKKGGIARISLFETGDKTSSGNKIFWEIWDNGKEISFIDYFKNVPNVQIGFGKREDNNNVIIYLEIKKSEKSDFKLELVGSINMNPIAPDRYGIRSIYHKIK